MENAFVNAFEYVNSKYEFNKENYPVIKNLTEEQALIFSLKHGLLHVLKSVNKIDDVPFEKISIRNFQWIAQPDEKLGAIPLMQKIATLKILVNIMSLANAIGITKEQVAEFEISTDEELIMLIPVKNIGAPIIPTFIDTIQYLIESLASFLERADHENQLNKKCVADLIKRVFLSIMYWFDDFWVPDFLSQIPNVMKSK